MLEVLNKPLEIFTGSGIMMGRKVPKWAKTSKLLASGSTFLGKV